MLNTIISFLNDNSELVALIASFFSWILGVFTSRGLKIWKKERLVRGLKLKKDCACRVILPTYNEMDLYPENRLKRKFDVNGKEDVLALLNIISLIQRTGLALNQDYFLFQEQYNSGFENCNVFCIGGIVANKQTAYYFSNYINEFRIYKRNVDESNNEEIKKFIADDTKRGFTWGDGKDYLVNKGEDYLILVRLTEEDIGADNAGTVYILYGNQINSTLEASKYLLCHTNDLIKRTRKKKHFFIVFKVKEAGGSYHLNFNEYRDLTDEMFPEKV